MGKRTGRERFTGDAEGCRLAFSEEVNIRQTPKDWTALLHHAHLILQGLLRRTVGSCPVQSQ